MKIIYRAIDGAEFEERSKCLEYEEKIYSEQLQFYTALGTRTYNYENATYIHVKGTSAEKAAYELFSRQVKTGELSPEWFKEYIEIYHSEKTVSSGLWCFQPGETIDGGTYCWIMGKDTLCNLYSDLV